MSANGSAIKIMIDPELKGLKGLKSGMVKAVAESTLVFSKKTATAFANNVKQSMRDLEAGVTKIKELEARLNKKGLVESEKKRVQEQIRDARARNGMIEQELKTRLKGQNKELRVRQDAFEKMAKSQASIKGIGEMGKKIGDEIKSAFDDVFKSKDLSKMIEGSLGRVGKGVTAAGGGLMKMGGGMGAFGEILSKIGPAISALSAVAVGFVAIFKIFMDADAHMKELNKTMLEGGTVANDLVGKYGMLGPSLNQVTKHFAAATRFSIELGTTAKENIQVLSAYGGANVSISKLTGGLKDASAQMRQLEDATTGAVAYARIFGTSYTEMATNFGDYMTRLGLTLEGVEERFSAIAVAARDSGFSTKRFMGTLLQATSGMSMYNVRIEETAGLLVSLGQILGEKMGGEFLQNLTQGLRGESAQDLTKRVLVTGEGTTRRIGQKAAAADAADLKRKVEAAGVNPKIAETLQQAGIDLSKSPEEIAKAIGMMPEKMADALKTKLSGFDTGIGGAFKGARQAGLSYQGGLGAAVAGARGSGPAATLLMNLSKTVGVLGKRLDEVSETDIVGQMAAEHISGKQGEEMMQYRAVGKEFQQRADELKKQSDLVAKGGDVSEFNKTLGKSWGTFIDESGRWFKGAQGMETEVGKRVYIDDKSMEGLVMASGEELTKMGQGAVAEDIVLAQEVAENTRSIQDILENGVAAVLSSINNTLSEFFSWVTGSGEVREKLLSMMQNTEREMEQGQKTISETQSQLGDLTAKLRDPNLKAEDRVGLQSAIVSKRAELESAKQKQEAKRFEMSDLRRIRTKDQMEKYSGTDLDVGALDFSGVSLEEGAKALQAKLAANAGSKRASAHLESMAPEARGALVKGAEKQGQAPVTFAKRVIANLADKARESGMDTGNFEKLDAVVGPLIQGVLQRQMAAKDLAAQTGAGQPAMPGFKMFGVELVKGQEEITADQAKQWQEDRKTEKKNVTTDIKTQNKVGKDLQASGTRDTETLIKTLTSLDEEGKVAALAGLLAESGMGLSEDPTAQARALLAGQPAVMSSGVRDTLLQRPEMAGFGPQVPNAAQSSRPAQDMVMQIGANGRIKFAQRVDANDVGVFSKPGGAIAQAGGRSGGGGVNVFHLYGEGPGVLNTITKAQAAGMIG